MKASAKFLAKLRDITTKINQLSDDAGTYDLDPDAIVDLNLARASIDKLINRVERLV